MASGIFEFACGSLERNTPLEKLEARGTVRLALKQSGLDAASVDSTQMAVMLKRVMPTELRARGVEDPEGVCNQMIRELKDHRLQSADPAQAGDSPEAIFRRLSGG